MLNSASYLILLVYSSRADVFVLLVLVHWLPVYIYVTRLLTSVGGWIFPGDGVSLSQGYPIAVLHSALALLESLGPSDFVIGCHLMMLTSEKPLHLYIVTLSN